MFNKNCFRGKLFTDSRNFEEIHLEPCLERTCSPETCSKIYDMLPTNITGQDFLRLFETFFLKYREMPEEFPPKYWIIATNPDDTIPGAAIHCGFRQFSDKCYPSWR